jgi:hypothetical protein
MQMSQRKIRRAMKDMGWDDWLINTTLQLHFPLTQFLHLPHYHIDWQCRRVDNQYLTRI